MRTICLPEPLDARAVTLNAIVVSALESAAAAERYGLCRDKIILSAKVSGVQDLITVYRDLAARCDYPLHLGLTEAGMGAKGIVASTAGLSVLLQEGIGDTIRVSLTPAPNGDRTEEVIVCQQILQSLELRSFTPQVAACPGCGRTTSTFFQEMAEQIQGYLRKQMPVWRDQHPGVEEMKVAVMGCVVNGPGESKHANIGISLPGTFEEPVAPVYVDGKLVTTLRGDGIVDTFIGMMNDYVARTYAAEEGAHGIALADDIRAGSLRAIARAATADRGARFARDRHPQGSVSLHRERRNLRHHRATGRRQEYARRSVTREFCGPRDVGWASSL